MSLTLNTTLSDIQQLRDISRMAHSSGLTTSGNIGLVGSQVVKFNTHLSERLFSKTTEAMLQSSNALRDTLRTLIGNVLSNDADAGLKDRLLAKLDAGGDHALLQRKVVAKVLDELGGHAGLEDLRQVAAQGSSKGLRTDFETVRTQALADGLWECRSQMSFKIVGMANDFANWLGKEPNSFNADQIREFKSLVRDFADQYAKQNADVNQFDKPVNREELGDAFALLARLATDGRPLKGEMGEFNDLSVNDFSVNGLEGACFAKLAHAKAGAARLLAHFTIDVSGRENLLNTILVNNKDLGQDDLTRDRVYELLLGEKPAPDAKLDDLSQEDFLRMLRKANADRMETLCAQRNLGRDAGRKLLDLVGGRTGVALSTDKALKLLEGGKEGIQLTEKDLKGASPLNMRNEDDEDDAKESLREGLTQASPKIHLEGRRIDQDYTYDLREGDGTFSRAGQDKIRDFIKNLGRVQMLKAQRIAAGVAMTKTFSTLLSMFPVKGGTNGAPQASFDLRVWMGSDDVTLSGQCGPTDGTGPHLSFSFTIKPDGQSELGSFKYTVPPQA